MSVSIPRRGAVLIVAESGSGWLDTLEGMVREQDSDADVWILEVKSGDGSPASIHDLFASVTDDRFADMVDRNSQQRISGLPLSQWTPFSKIYLQRDWICGQAPPDRQDFSGCTGSLPPKPEKLLPAGAALLRILRHEYSIDSRTRLETLYDGCRFSELEKGGFECEATDLEWMQALLSRVMWNQILSRQGQPGRIATVVYCENEPKRAIQFLRFIGEDSYSRRLEERFESARGAATGICRPVLPTPRGPGDTEDPGVTSDGTKPDKWDEEIVYAIHNSDQLGAAQARPDSLYRGEADWPVFILCDYDLDSSALPDGKDSQTVPVTGAKLAALVKSHLIACRHERTVSAIAFTGGSSPVIAQECIELGCDFVVRNSSRPARAEDNPHTNPNIDGFTSLTLWVWTILFHERLLRRIESSLQQCNLDDVPRLMEYAHRVVVRREMVVPRSLVPRLDGVRRCGSQRLQKLGLQKLGTRPTP